MFDPKEADTFILFTLAGATYGIRSTSVRQMEMIENITPVPNAPSYVEGVAFSRGKVVPVINLRKRFGFEQVAHDLRSRLIVVAIEDRLIGLIADTAREFVRIPAEAFQPPPDSLTGDDSQYIEAIAVVNDRLIFILDVVKIPRIAEHKA